MKLLFKLFSLFCIFTSQLILGMQTTETTNPKYLHNYLKNTTKTLPCNALETLQVLASCPSNNLEGKELSEVSFSFDDEIGFFYPLECQIPMPFFLNNSDVDIPTEQTFLDPFKTSSEDYPIQPNPTLPEFPKLEENLETQSIPVKKRRSERLLDKTNPIQKKRIEPIGQNELRDSANLLERYKKKLDKEANECEKCGYSFEKQQSLSRHLFDHCKATIECIELSCPKIFRTLKTYEKHLWQRHGIRLNQRKNDQDPIN